MASHEIHGGQVNAYRRVTSPGVAPHLSTASYRTDAKEMGLEQAKAFAKNWYLLLGAGWQRD